ncbi:MAG: ATP-dependent RNA helicase DbpA [Polyangiaceae bacterium]|nr:ATP-dependent RNA helicase DbpA [Polyangiaceae bacterium]
MPSDTDPSTLALSPELLEVVQALGYEQLTPIQAAAIPRILEGKDVVGQSKTGSGKTAAFALPILQRLKLQPRELSTIVLCPTRELGAQIAREFRKLGRNLPGLSLVVLAGGQPLRDQTSALTTGVHVVIGTPGRVLDHLRRRTLRVHNVNTVVLDEADRMLDMGFAPDMAKILKALPSARQTIFFSATFPPSMQELSCKYQRDPLQISIDQPDEPRDIRQLVVHVAAEHKPQALLNTLQTHRHDSALVFANLKLSVAKLEAVLSAAGISVASLHGDLKQFDRDRVMAKFRNGSTRVLVATDVAARGIDLDKLDLVVNYELPSQPEVYLHRVGRTGRAGNQGLAVSLCAPAEQARLEAIEHYVGTTLTPTQHSPRPSKERETPSKAVVRDASMDTLKLYGGRKEKLRPGDILGALTGDAGGLKGEDIGKIELHERFAYVAIKKNVSERAFESLRTGRIKGKKFRVERVS